VFFLLVAIYTTTACGQHTRFNKDTNRISYFNINYNESEFIKLVKGNNCDMVKQYLESGMNPNCKDNSGIPAMIWSVKEGNIEILKLFFNFNANPNITDNDNNTALMHAVLEGSPRVIDILLENGAMVDLSNNDHRTALLMSVMEYNNTYQTLSQINQGKQVKNNISNTTLRKYSQITHNLLTHNANADIRDRLTGTAPIILLSKCGNIDLVGEILQNDINVDIADNKGRFALWYAAQNGHAQIVDMLIEYGAKINMQDLEMGMTPLMRASLRGHVKIVEILLKHGADTEIKDSVTGKTALILTASSENWEHILVAKLLIKNGANLDIKDNYGNTALDLAKWGQKKGSEMVKLLEASK